MHVYEYIYIYIYIYIYNMLCINESLQQLTSYIMHIKLI